MNILAEVIIPIAHNLIAAPGSSFDEIAVVESHPVALAQCEQFFSANPRLKRVATEDTAGSVRDVVRAGDRTRAAIAGRRAAEIYGGAILREHLEDNSENYTRFLLLSTSSDVAGKCGQAFAGVSARSSAGRACSLARTVCAAKYQSDEDREPAGARKSRGNTVFIWTCRRRGAIRRLPRRWRNWKTWWWICGFSGRTFPRRDRTARNLSSLRGLENDFQHGGRSNRCSKSITSWIGSRSAATKRT